MLHEYEETCKQLHSTSDKQQIQILFSKIKAIKKANHLKQIYARGQNLYLKLQSLFFLASLKYFEIIQNKNRLKSLNKHLGMTVLPLLPLFSCSNSQQRERTSPSSNLASEQSSSSFPTK